MMLRLLVSLLLVIHVGCSMTGSASTSVTATRADGSQVVVAFTEIFHGVTGNVQMTSSKGPGDVLDIVMSKTGRYQITAQAVLRNGQPFIKIPVSAKNVDVVVDGATVKVTVDGKPFDPSATVENDEAEETDADTESDPAEAAHTELPSEPDSEAE